MPIVVLEIPETEESITRPIAATIARQMAERIGAPKDTRVLLPFRDLGIPNANSTLLVDTNDPNRIASTNWLELTYDEEPAEWNQLTRAYTKTENQSIFTDSKLGIYLKPNYQMTKVTLQCTLRGTDSATMARWVKSLKHRVEQEETGYIHKVNYHYPIPEAYLLMIAEFHAMRETNQPYGDSLGEYLSKCFVRNLGSIKNAAGNHQTYVIREQQVQITGWFDFGNMIPKEEKANDTGAYQITFNYHYYYDRCDDMIFEYPFIIHNQFISDRLYDAEIPDEVRNYLSRSGYTQFATEPFGYDHDVGLPEKTTPGLPIPYFDNWIEPLKQDSYVNLVRLLLTVDIEDPQSLVNLEDLGDWYLDDEVIKYLRQVKHKVAIPYKTIINFKLYSFNSLMDTGNIQLTEDLEVRTTDIPEQRNVHHLVISLLTDPTKLDREGISDLAENGCFTLKYFQTVFPNAKLYPAVDEWCKMNEDDVLKFFDEQAKTNNLSFNYKHTSMFTVNSLVIRSSLTSKQQG